MNNLLVDKFEVVAKVQKPDGVEMGEPFLLPFYDLERFPFLITIGENDFFIVNTKAKSM